MMSPETVKRNSICPCGFPVLQEPRGIGTVYEIDREKTTVVDWYCGGCRQVSKHRAVWALGSDGNPGYLPLGIFEPNN
jgi:hypothetical protein